MICAGPPVNPGSMKFKPVPRNLPAPPASARLDPSVVIVPVGPLEIGVWPPDKMMGETGLLVKIPGFWNIPGLLLMITGLVNVPGLLNMMGLLKIPLCEAVPILAISARLRSDSCFLARPGALAMIWKGWPPPRTTGIWIGLITGLINVGG